MKRRKRLSTLTRPANIAPFKLATFVIDSSIQRHLTKKIENLKLNILVRWRFVHESADLSMTNVPNLKGAM